MHRPERKKAAREPLVRSIISEALRNVTSGASRALILAIAFALTAGGLSWAAIRAVEQLASRAETYLASGAAVHIITLPGTINGQECDNLANTPGILAAGALRAGPEITPAALPSRAISTYQVTAGFGRLLALTRSNRPWADGAWLSQEVATDLGVGQGTSSLPLANGTTLPVVGVYADPNDGRDSNLEYEILLPVAPVSAFDSCYALLWPSATAAAGLLRISANYHPSTSDSTSGQAQLSQLNTTLGTDFDTKVLLRTLPSKPLGLAGLLVGMCLGMVAIRIRRLELASQLHAGYPRASLALQLMLEVAIWAALGACPALVGSYWMALDASAGTFWSALVPGIATITLTGIGAVLGAQLTLLLVREKHLFRYFKAR
jgi:hypothetical protein